MENNNQKNITKWLYNRSYVVFVLFVSVLLVIKIQNCNSGFSFKPFTRIRINSDGAASLERLPGIGPSLARKIVDFREIAIQTAPDTQVFGSKEDLMRVKGIGVSKSDQMQAFVSFE